MSFKYKMIILLWLIYNFPTFHFYFLILNHTVIQFFDINVDLIFNMWNQRDEMATAQKWQTVRFEL